MQKIRNQKFSASLNKTRVNLLLEAILFLRTKGFQTHLGNCVKCKNVHFRKNTRERWSNSRLALFAWLTRAKLLAGIAKTATGKACMSAKHLVDWDWIVSKYSKTNEVFHAAVFLIRVIRNNKRSPGNSSKISDCLSRICLYYRYLLLRFC